jgi:hypothetical protein
MVEWSNTNINYLTDRSLSLDPNSGQMNPNKPLYAKPFQIDFYVILPSTPGPFKRRLPLILRLTFCFCSSHGSNLVFLDVTILRILGEGCRFSSLEFFQPPVLSLKPNRSYMGLVRTLNYGHIFVVSLCGGALYPQQYYNAQ